MLLRLVASSAVSSSPVLSGQLHVPGMASRDARSERWMDEGFFLTFACLGLACSVPARTLRHVPHCLPSRAPLVALLHFVTSKGRDRPQQPSAALRHHPESALPVGPHHPGQGRATQSSALFFPCCSLPRQVRQLCWNEESTSEWSRPISGSTLAPGSRQYPHPARCEPDVEGGTNTMILGVPF